MSAPVQSTYLPADSDSPVNQSVTPGSDAARAMTVGSGRRLRGLLPRRGPVGACLRTLAVSSRWASTACWLTWKPSATPRGRLLFRLVPSVPRTAAPASGSLALWPTPRASERENRTTKPTPSQLAGKHGRYLASEVLAEERRLWPTPRHEGFDAGAHRGNPDSLHAAVKLLPTPTLNGNHNRKGASPTSGDGLQTVVGGRLSAAWVTRLMGFPDGWLDLP